MSVDSPFKLGPGGTGVIQDVVVRRAQHAYTKVRENKRAQDSLAALKLKLNRRGIMSGRDEAVFLSINRLSVEFVGLPKMRWTVRDNTTFQECWSIYMMASASLICAQWIGTRGCVQEGPPCEPIWG